MEISPFSENFKGLYKCNSPKTHYYRVGDDLRNISLKDFGSAIDIPGGNLPFPNGASSLINALDTNCNVLLEKVSR